MGQVCIVFCERNGIYEATCCTQERLQRKLMAEWESVLEKLIYGNVQCCGVFFVRMKDCKKHNMFW